METIIYPIVGTERDLPIYVTCIGSNDRQIKIVRPDGYFDTQLIYCTDGKGRLTIEGKNYTITAGMCFFLPKRIPHDYEPLGNVWTTNWVAFDGYACAMILNRLGLTQPAVYTISDLRPLEHIFQKMLFSIKSDRMYGGYTASGLVYEYLIEFNRIITNTTKPQCSEEDSFLLPVLNYIDNNYDKLIELKTLCSIASVTPQYLCRVFKKNMDMRPLEYVAKKRIQQAKHLLISTQMSVKEIGVSVGYSDTSYFCSVFRRNEGVSPNEYRSKRC